MTKGHRAQIEQFESRQLLATISGLVWNDLDGDKVKDTREKWFSLDGTNQASITLYADYNGNGHFDTGEPSTTATKEGGYKLTVDGPASGAGPRPIAVRMTYAINTATQTNTGVFGMVPVVLVTSNSAALDNVNVPLEKAGIVTGKFYTDENANNKLDGTEVARNKAYVFFDDNNNGVRENEEPFVPIEGTSAADYKYTLPVPLGEGNLRIVRIFETDSVTIDPVTVTAEAGKSYTRDFRIVPEMKLNGKLFNDINGNGKKNKGEAYVSGLRTWFDFNQNNVWDKDTEPSAVSASDGSYELMTRKTTSIYGVNVLFRRNVTSNITSTLNLRRIVFKSIQETQTYNFGFKPAGISVQVFNDPNKSKTIDAGDSPVEFMRVFIDTNGNKVQDADEKSVLTDGNGIATFDNLATTPAPKTYKVIVRVSSKFELTSTSNEFNVTLDPFEQESLTLGVNRL